MSIEWVNRAIDGLRAWRRAKGINVDVDEVRLLCDYASDYLGVNALGDFRTGTFEDLLLEIYPRKVIAPPESAAETIAAARTLADFLLDTGEIDDQTAAAMRQTIDEIEPEMPRVLADTSKFGMAKSIFSAIGPDLLDPTGPGSADWTGDPGQDDLAIAELSGAELLDCTDLAVECDLGGDALPAVRLPPPDEVARAVREVPLVRDAHRVVAWMVDGGHTTTVRRALRVRDARRLAAELGVERPALAWCLALHLGWAQVTGTAVSAGEGFQPLPALSDQEVLELWLGTLRFLGDAPVPVTHAELVDEELDAVCDLLYRARAPVPTERVEDYLRGVADGRATDRLAEALTDLGYAGVVQCGENGLTLTPHALWGLREIYQGHGVEAPVAPDLADSDANGLIAGLIGDGLPVEQAERDIAGWLRRRTPEQAAAELLAAVVGAPAEVRGVAVTIVDRLGPEAAPAVRACLDDPELRPHAIHWLSARGLDAPALTHEELLWVSVDMLALTLPAAEADPESFMENIAASGPPRHLIEDMWRVDHPDVVDVLELLGNTLTDRLAAKAARKAAFKARSRSIR